MVNLKPVEKRFFEDIFNMKTGYVLDYTNDSFAELFRDTVNINIYDDKFAFNGDSKAKRLRAFWEIESDEIVGKVLKELLEVWKYNQDKIDKNVDNAYQKGLEIVNRLINNQKNIIKEEFLSKEFKYDLKKLKLTPKFFHVIEQRLLEIQICLKNNASLAVIFLCGSVLEGLLLNLTNKYPKKFNNSKLAPKNKNGKVKSFNEWTLSNLIDVSQEIGFLGLDVKKYSHSLRYFRNYIHPNEQIKAEFTPNEYTALISWKVLEAAIADLNKMEEQYYD